jgi:pimeloyl-ACP methyl ester carboxylesterase
VAFEGSQITRSVTRVSGFRDAEFDYQLLRAMGAADYGGSTVGECLVAAGMITDGDTGSWVRAFCDLAARVEARAAACRDAGHLVSARDHFMRASTYHRTAEYYAEADPDVLAECGRRSRACFEAAALLFDPPIEPLSIPFENGFLPGYLVRPRPGTAPAGRPRGTLVAFGGFDSGAEEMYFQLGAAGAARGWQVVLFDGPGQTGCMRQNPTMTYRPDYEAPVGAVLDDVVARFGAGEGFLALAGMSIGGYFAARTAAHDDRVGALVADSPLVDLYRYFEAFLGPEVFRMHRDIRPEDVAGIPEDLLPAQMLWGIAAVCRRFGVASLQEWKTRLRAYRLDSALAAVSCPALALVGLREGPEVLRQADEFTAGVTGPVTSHRFSVDDGADAHCQANNLRLSTQVIFDWLDDLVSPALT